MTQVPNLPIPGDKRQPDQAKIIADYDKVAGSVLGFIREHSSLLQSASRPLETPADDLRSAGFQWSSLLWAGAVAAQWLLFARS